MKTRNQLIVRVMMAIAILFAVNVTADAQFGNLVKKAKGVAKEKVKEKVGQATGTTTVGTADGADNATVGNTAGMEVAPKGWRYHGGKVHRFVPNETDEILKFLELNQTPEMQKVYSYYDLSSSETINSPANTDYQSVAQDLVRLEWDLHDVEGSLGGMSPEGWIKQLDKELSDKINRAASYNQEPAEVADYFDAELQRVKARFHDKYFPGEEKLVGKDVSGYLAERTAGRAEYKYGLNELKDNGSNPKMKQQFEAQVKSQLKPDRILATYIVSNFWRGMPCKQMPEYGEEWASVQEKPMKTYYMKGGKYYYVKGGFRQGYKSDDPGMSSKPIANYNPGLEAPIEIPAAIAKKYFK